MYDKDGEAGAQEISHRCNGGALASNYTLSGGVDWVSVTPLPLQ